MQMVGGACLVCPGSKPSSTLGAVVPGAIEQAVRCLRLTAFGAKELAE